MLVVRGLDKSMVEQLRRAAVRQGRSLDAEIALVLSAHLSRIPGVSGARTVAASGSQIDQSMPPKCEKLTPLKSGLQMLLEVSSRIDQGEPLCRRP